MKIALTLTPGRVVLYEAAAIYFIEAVGDDARIRTAGKTLLESTSTLAAWERKLGKHGFVRVHRSWIVNVERIRELRHRKAGPDAWELKLEPPVNKVLPVSGDGLKRLKARLGF